MPVHCSAQRLYAYDEAHEQKADILPAQKWDGAQKETSVYNIALKYNFNSAISRVEQSSFKYSCRLKNLWFSVPGSFNNVGKQRRKSKKTMKEFKKHNKLDILLL